MVWFFIIGLVLFLPILILIGLFMHVLNKIFHFSKTPIFKYKREAFTEDGPWYNDKEDIHTTPQNPPAQSSKKIFDKNDGEYVEFEEISE